MAGEFEQLLPFTWRGKHYPISRILLSLAHDLVEHKYWGVDGGRVESTGIAPVRIAAVIPISNHIFPGKKEKWTAGALYPDGLRKFLIDFGKKTTDYVQHPEFGEIACKPERMDFELSGERRGATEIHASWVETLDDDVVTKVVNSPITEIEFAAADLEASGVDLKALAPDLPDFIFGLSDLARKLSSFPDAFTVTSYRYAGAINNLFYQAGRIQLAVDRAKDARTWVVTQNIHRIKAACHTLRKAFLSPGGIGLYVVPAPTTLAGVTAALPRGTDIGDLIKLNPGLVRSPVVSKGTTIRYRLAA